MRISNKTIAALLLCGAALAGMAGGDEITLAGDEARLSGSVRSLSPDGTVELTTELSSGPVSLKGDAVRRISFNGCPDASTTVTALVELTDGDLLPADIESLDSQTLVLVSPGMGRLKIPRDKVRSLQPGVRGSRIIYQGPRALEEWSAIDGGMENWNFERDALVSTGPSTASMKLPLTSSFVMRFTLVWQEGMVPNFQISYADPLVAKGTPCNRYYMQFGGAGIEIKREAASGKRWHTLAVLNTPADQFLERRLHVEISVNRDTSRMKLTINGESEGEFADPIDSLPDGGGITFVCNTPNGGTQQVRDIQILEHNDTGIRHRTEERGDPAQDSLITAEEERWTGSLVGTRNDGKGNRFLFKTGFRNEPVEIPESEISMIFLGGSQSGQPKPTPPPFQLKLQGGGALGVTSCVFDGESAVATHPLLGRLAMKRDGILAIERIKTEPSSEPGK